RIYFRLGFQRKDFDPVFCIFIARIEPKLVILIWRSLFRIQPYRPAFCFAELVAVGLLNKLGREPESRAALLPADELRSSNDVAPLVRPAHLKHTAVVFPKIKEIVTLYQLVGEFGKR